MVTDPTCLMNDNP